MGHAAEGKCSTQGSAARRACSPCQMEPGHRLTSSSSKRKPSCITTFYVLAFYVLARFKPIQSFTAWPQCRGALPLCRCCRASEIVLVIIAAP